MKQRALIFAGGHLGRWALNEIRQDDVLIGADRGALFLIEHQIRPEVAIGDFDSVSDDQKARIRREANQFVDCDPILKDYTDTEMAMQTAMQLQPRPEEIVLLGALGGRFDHALANVHLLKKALDEEIPCTIIDENNKIRLVDAAHPIAVENGPFTHFSLLPLSLLVTGVTLDGFQYPLHDATLELGKTLGISNVIQQPQGRVEVGSGLLLAIQSKDAHTGKGYEKE